MTEWLSEEDKEKWVALVNSRLKIGIDGPEDVLKTKMELHAAEVAMRVAIASERNAKYMLWATIFAALSAVGALGSAIITLVMRH
jgi:hypothetical protein